MLSNVNVDCLYLSAIRDEHAQHTVPYAGRVPVPGEVWVTLNLRYEADKCFEIIGNQVERAVEWNDSADISTLAGTPVRVRFVMKDADLYAIQFK